MNSNEWPLVFFTVLSQLSLGIIFAAFVLSFTMRNSADPALESLKKLMIIASISAMGVALIISFLHLASPLHAVYAISNTASSWLSKEILLALMYFFTLIVCFTAAKYNVPHSSMFGYFFLASLFVGTMMVWSMAQVYMIPTVPLWNSPATPVAFFNTAIMLGSGLLLVLITSYSMRVNVVPDIKQFQTALFYLVAASAFIYLLNTLLLQPDVTSVAGSFRAPSISAFWGISQKVLMVIGFGLLTYWYTTQTVITTAGKHWMLVFAVAFLLLAELAGRYVFYASYYRVGI
jgi:anaerobic dimethyl sulfoxide reductase subunit C